MAHARFCVCLDAWIPTIDITQARALTGGIDVYIGADMTDHSTIASKPQFDSRKDNNERNS